MREGHRHQALPHWRRRTAHAHHRQRRRCRLDKGGARMLVAHPGCKGGFTSDKSKPAMKVPGNAVFHCGFRILLALLMATVQRAVAYQSGRPLSWSKDVKCHVNPKQSTRHPETSWRPHRNFARGRFYARPLDRLERYLGLMDAATSSTAIYSRRAADPNGTASVYGCRAQAVMHCLPEAAGPWLWCDITYNISRQLLRVIFPLQQWATWPQCFHAHQKSTSRKNPGIYSRGGC
jgi:hypothetical protein